MAEKKKPAKKRTEAEEEPGFFSDYGYGNGTAITLLNPPQTRKTPKNTRTSRKKRK